MKKDRLKNRDARESTRCIVCGNINPARFRIKYRKPTFHVMECLDCTFSFIPSTFRKSIDYTHYKSSDVAEEVGRSDVWLKIQRNLLRYRLIRKCQPSGKIYDIGCGFGHFLLTGKQLGYHVSGVEMSKANVEYVRKQVGIPVDEGDFLRVREGEQYDVMTLWDVLEHMDTADRVIEKASHMTRPGGFLFVQVPQIDSLLASILEDKWWAMGLDHANYFSRKTIRLLLEKNGFKVMNIFSSMELKNLLVYVILPKLRPKKKQSNLTAALRQREFNRMTRKSSRMRSILVALHNAIYKGLSILKIGDEMIVVALRL